VADVVADCGGARVIIEVKRGIVDLNAVSQLKRYVDAVPGSRGILVGSWFTSGAVELARELGFRVVEY
jgi:predicted RecB family endonuclease